MLIHCIQTAYEYMFDKLPSQFQCRSLSKILIFNGVGEGARRILMLDGDSLVLLDVMMVDFSTCFILTR